MKLNTLHKLKKIITVAIVLIGLMTVKNAYSQDMDEVVRRMVENALVGGLYIKGEVIVCQQSLYTFYERRQFNLAWANDKMVTDFINWVKESKWHGLDPADYHYKIINEIWNNKKAVLTSPRMQASFDLALTDAFLLLTGHLLAGKVDPYKTDTNWFAVKNEGDPVTLLEQTIIEKNISQTLKNTLPNHKAYALLVEQLKHYTEINEQGGWAPVDMLSLDTGNQREGMLQLKERLYLTGDLVQDGSTRQEDAINEAIKNFQKRHGLTPDGVIGKQTLEALNDPVDKKIEQIMINLERFRWLNRDLGAYYILVNIANYELEVFKQNQKVDHRRVIVGKAFRKTPVFSSTLKYIVFNPDWTVPPTILNQDIIPSVRKDPGYLASKKIKVVNFDGSVIDPSTIDWTLYPGKPFPYQLKQSPGPENALGTMKFIFPNKYNVYLHDTPQRSLFEKTERAFSSGCIRVEDPAGLAALVLDDQQGWSREKVNQVVQSGKTQTFFLNRKVDVHLQYFTAWVNEDGQLHFRKDIYNRDPAVWEALNIHLYEN